MFSAQIAWRDLPMMVAPVLIFALTAGLAVLTIGACFDIFPWIDVPLRLGDWTPSNAGMVLQVLVLLLLVVQCLLLPSLRRIADLEMGHRSFRISLDDVARAYRIAHAADRAGVFALSAEFESIRQRMDVLRRHPDLGDLEPELLELASVMSHQSRDLARIYSEQKVDRARRFLRQRQEEVDALAERLKLARQLVGELRTWLTDVEAEERQAHVQIKRLEADLRELLPALGLELGEPARADGNVVSLPKPLK